MAASTAGGGLEGKRVEPILVPILMLVTLGIYSLFWYWRATKEIDAATGSRAHPMFKATLGLWLVTIVLYVAAIAALVAAVADAAAAAEAPGGLAVEPAFGGVASMTLAGFVALAAFVTFLVAIWRVLKALEGQERARAAPEVISPGLMLALLVVPLVNLVGTYYVPYRVQKGLNGLWAGQAIPRAATPPA